MTLMIDTLFAFGPSRVSELGARYRPELSANTLFFAFRQCFSHLRRVQRIIVIIRAGAREAYSSNRVIGYALSIGTIRRVQEKDN